MRERPPVDEGGRDHGGAHARRGEARELGLEPDGIAQREVRHRVQPSAAFLHDRLAPAVPRRHVGRERGQIARERALPDEPVVREADRLVDAERRELVAARRRVPVVARQDLVVARERRGAARSRRRRSPIASVSPGVCTSATESTRSRHSTRTCPSASSTKRIASPRRAGSMCSSHRPRYSYKCWSESITGRMPASRADCRAVYAPGRAHG